MKILKSMKEKFAEFVVQSMKKICGNLRNLSCSSNS